MKGRFDILHRIERLDPERDHMQIVHLSFGYEFSWDAIRALEIALYRTYCVPSISRLLDRTGEFHERAQRRYDDTSLIISELCEWGYVEGRGKLALERLNWAHGHYHITNDDFLYVLSTFVYEPIRWIDRFGWRRLSEQERHAFYYFWREVGRRMGIHDIPPGLDAFEAFNVAYERRHFEYAESNRRVGTSTRELFVSWVPRIFAPVVRQGIYALLDDSVLKAFGFPRPVPGMKTLTTTLLRLRGRAIRFLPPRSRAHFFSDTRNRTYPTGYEISELGPPKLVARENRSSTGAVPSED